MVDTVKQPSGLSKGQAGTSFTMPKVLPVCGSCGEPGIHGTMDECLVQLRRTVAALEAGAGDPVIVLPQPVQVQKIPAGVSGWLA